MEAIRPQEIDGEQVYTITAIGATADTAEQMRRDARRVRVQEFVRRHAEAEQTVGNTVDIEL